MAGLVVGAVGMAFEARIAAGLGTSVICSGDGRNLAATLERAIASGRCGLVSFGIAGGLASGLRPGDCVVASEIVDGEKRIATDRAWSQRLLQTSPSTSYSKCEGRAAPHMGIVAFA